MPLNLRDPRTHITAESFGMAPELLGLPLATPLRRAVAMLCDLVPVAILANAGGGVALALFAALALFRAAAARSKQGRLRTGVRGVFRLGGAILLFVVVLKVWGAGQRLVSREEHANDREEQTIDIGDRSVALDLGLGDVARLPDLIALSTPGDPDERTEHARRLADWVREKGDDAEARNDLAAGILDAVDDSAGRQALRAALAPMLVADTTRAAPADSTLLRYAHARLAGDTATIRTLEPLATDILAGERLRDLERETRSLERQRAELRQNLEEQEDEGRGLTGWIGAIANDLGIGFGWTALYFTAFLALWHGQTPGKKLVGIQVIRLDGRPLGWWLSFERFGGYAASLSTGLLGFLQILWDRNRQGLHDKAADTVVIRVTAGPLRPDPRAAAPPPAPR